MHLALFPADRQLPNFAAEGSTGRGTAAREHQAGDTLEVYAAGEQLAFKVTQPEQSEPANGSSLRSRG
jgi:hypothetical protein